MLPNCEITFVVDLKFLFNCDISFCSSIEFLFLHSVIAYPHQYIFALTCNFLSNVKRSN